MLKILTMSAVMAVSIGVSAFASTAPVSKGEFCQKRSKKYYFKSLAYEPTNQLTFSNYGGLFNGGVCWWHSLFQRSALYLAVFRPELPKPDQAVAKKIIHMIAHGARVVEIPGYRNLSEFSDQWHEEIQEKLEDWQKVDGFLKQQWIKGLSGSYETDPHEIFQRLIYLQTSVEIDDNIEWAMFQLKGIVAHAGLFLNLSYERSFFFMKYLDSNHVGETSTLRYFQGSRSVDSEYGPLVPYVGRRSDLERFKQVAQSYCDSKSKNWGLPGDTENYPLNNDIQ